MKETNNLDNIPNWINKKTVSLLHKSNITPKNFYFLYAFLGDGYNIENKEYINNLLQWLKLHNKDWNINILRRGFDQIDLFVKTYFNWFWLSYKQYTKNIQRCDVIRYMLMYQYGGVYSDLDVKPSISVDYLLEKYKWANVIFGIGREKPLEKCKHTTRVESIRNGELEIPIRVANYFFISRIPYHPIWIDILKLAKKRAHLPLNSQYGIIYTTGPDIVTTSISNNRTKYNDIAIIPHDEFTKFFHHSCSSFTNGSWRKRTQLPIGENGKNTV